MTRSTSWKIGAVALAACLVAAANADILWGVTNGAGDAGFWSGGEIFTVDTDTGAVDVKATFQAADDNVMAFGDIAVSNTGDVFVTYRATDSSADGFDQFAKVDLSTGGFAWTQDLGGYWNQVNALDFIGGQLYGVTGGGIDAYLQKFTLGAGSVTVDTIGSLGANSDGDLAFDPVTGKIAYTSWETGSKSDLKYIDLDANTDSVQEISTSSGWAGLEFGRDGTLYAGTYWDQKLYTFGVDPTDPNYIVGTVAHDLSGALGGTITGLSTVVPVPGAALLGVLGLGIVARIKRSVS